jgi:ribose transport system substrate-binding protein
MARERISQTIVEASKHTRREMRFNAHIRCHALAGVAAAAVVVAIVGCGSAASTTSTGGAGGSSSSGGAKGGMSSAALSAAQQRVQQAMQKPQSFTVTAPLTKRPKPGAVISVVYPPIPQVVYSNGWLQTGASLLGMKVALHSIGTTADSFQTAFAAAIADKPAAVWVSALDPKTWAPYAKQFQQLGIPIINQGTTWADVAGKQYDYSELQQWGNTIKPLMDWAMVDSGGKPLDMLFVNITGVPVTQSASGIMSSYLTQICSGCQTSSLTMAESDIGAGGVTRVTGFLQAHPSYKYVVFPLGDAATGVPPAVKAAGMSDVKILTGGAGADLSPDVESGAISANMGYDSSQQGFIIPDFVARATTGQSTQPDFNYVVPAQLITKANFSGSPSSYYTIASRTASVAAWSKVWGLSGR